MEPLGATASVIAVAGLAAQSARAVYQVMDGLIEAPHAIANSKALVAGTQDSLNSLAGTLTTSPETQARFGSVLRSIDLEKTLKSTQELCDRFHTAITGYTRHSTDARFSNRDRMLVNLHEQQIAQFNNQLSGCQRTISLVIETITLYVLLFLLLLLFQEAGWGQAIGTKMQTKLGRELALANQIRCLQDRHLPYLERRCRVKRAVASPGTGSIRFGHRVSKSIDLPQVHKEHHRGQADQL